MEAPELIIPTLTEFVDGALLDAEARMARAKVQQALVLHIGKNFELHTEVFNDDERRAFQEELNHGQLGAEKDPAIIVGLISAPFRNWFDNVCVANGMSLEEFVRDFGSDDNVDKSAAVLDAVMNAPGNQVFSEQFHRVFIPAAPISQVSGVFHRDTLLALRFIDEDTAIPHLPDMAQSA